MKKTLIALAVLITALSSCNQSKQYEANFVSSHWKVYNLSDSTMLAVPSFDSDIQKPFIVRTIK